MRILRWSAPVKRLRWQLAALVLPALVAPLWSASSAFACKSPSIPHVIDPQAAASDTSPPAAPSVSVTQIRRGKGPDTDFGSCSQTATSCDSMGSIELQIRAEDDQTPADKMGYQIELIAGALPSGLTLPTQAVRALGSAVYLAWADGSTDDQESLSFLAVHPCGGPCGQPWPGDHRQVHDGGSGCHLAARTPLSAWPLTTVAILLLARLLRACPRRRQEAR